MRLAPVASTMVAVLTLTATAAVTGSISHVERRNPGQSLTSEQHIDPTAIDETRHLAARDSGRLEPRHPGQSSTSERLIDSDSNEDVRHLTARSSEGAVLYPYGLLRRGITDEASPLIVRSGVPKEKSPTRSTAPNKETSATSSPMHRGEVHAAPPTRVWESEEEKRLAQKWLYAGILEHGEHFSGLPPKIGGEATEPRLYDGGKTSHHGFFFRPN